jgi:GT2 family glycosyltransferase
MPEISVVVPTRERTGRLKALLAALEAQTLDRARFEVIVIHDEEGAGPAATRNRGWRQAGGNLIAFTDDDCEPRPDWLEQLLTAHGAAPDAILQGRTDPIIRELDRLGPFAHTRVVDRPSIYFETCNIAYPRALLERLGGFDEAFPEPSGEDADLGWRALEAGARRLWVANARVAHAVEEVGVRGYLRAARRGPTSMAMMKRHPELRELATYRRHFWHRNHLLMLVTLAGTTIAVAGTIATNGLTAIALVTAGLLASLPWLRTLTARVGASGGRLSHAPAHAAFDLVEIASCVRYSAAARVLIV